MSLQSSVVFIMLILSLTTVITDKIRLDNKVSSKLANNIVHFEKNCDPNSGGMK